MEIAEWKTEVKCQIEGHLKFSVLTMCHLVTFAIYNLFLFSPLLTLQGFGRGRIALSQTNVLRSLEQEEPFDLSQKSQGKGISFHSDGESAKGSSCQEEEEDNCYEAEQYSPGMYHHDKLYTPQDLSGKPDCMMKGFRESYCNENEEMLSEGGLEKRIGDSDNQESQGERDTTNNKEHLSFRSFEKARLGHSLSDYLYFKHRNKSLKELLERKMEKQTMLIGI